MCLSCAGGTVMAIQAPSGTHLKAEQVSVVLIE